MAYNKEAQDRYRKKATRVFTFMVFRNTEADIMEKLESVDSISGYVKGLIRKDIGTPQKQSTDI